LLDCFNSDECGHYFGEAGYLSLIMLPESQLFLILRIV
jgi:hypothetical protein